MHAKTQYKDLKKQVLFGYQKKDVVATLSGAQKIK